MRIIMICVVFTCISFRTRIDRTLYEKTGTVLYKGKKYLVNILKRSSLSFCNNKAEKYRLDEPLITTDAGEKKKKN